MYFKFDTVFSKIYFHTDLRWNHNFGSNHKKELVYIRVPALSQQSQLSSWRETVDSANAADSRDGRAGQHKIGISSSISRNLPKELCATYYCILLKYGFCNKSFLKDETLTSSKLWNQVTSSGHHNTQPVLFFSRARIFHLERLEKVTWFHSFGPVEHFFNIFLLTFGWVCWVQ